MKNPIVTSILSIIFFACLSFPQQTTERVSLLFSVVPRPSVVVTNNYASPITGLLIETDSTAPNGGSRIAGMAGLDTGINFPHDRPIQVGESRTFDIGYFRGENTATLKPRLMAAVFADGTSVGDPASISSIFVRRENAYKELATLQAFLSDALKNERDSATVLSSLHQMDESTANSTLGADYKIAVRHVLYMVISNLERAKVDGEVGNPQRTIPVLLDAMHKWQDALKPLLNRG